MKPDIIPLFIQISRFNFSKTSLDKAEVDRDIINDDTGDATVEHICYTRNNVGHHNIVWFGAEKHFFKISDQLGFPIPYIRRIFHPVPIRKKHG